MAKRKKSFCIVTVPLYDFTVFVSIGQTHEELKKDFDKCKFEYGNYFEHEHTVGRSTHFNTECVIRLRDFEHGVLAHEIYHTVCSLLRHIGLKYCSKSEEAYAYFISFLTEKIYEKIKKQNF